MTEYKRIRKFRGISPHNGKWIYGYLVPRGILEDADYLEEYWIATGLENECYPVKSETIGQFTGLLDKNKKEIYEGDITKEGDVIKFECGCFWIYKKERTSILQASPLGCYPLYRIDTERFIEVIGNIYENRELLADENQL